jgi:NAD(P)-dependent dehydrogenase (short-subunit alcohol dehydrogenase family)
MVDLTGQVALVTGATSGLGRRFAQVLAGAGASVVVTGRRTERLDELVTEIERNGGTALALRLDMTDSDEIVAVVDSASERLGPITVLVNNAGVPDARRAHKMPIELVDTVFDTNLRGPWVLATEVARRLIEARRPGRIVNIASMAGFHYAGGGAALYSVTKAGIIRMTEVLAVEWSRYEINVNCIAPGAFESEMMDGMIERMGDFRANLPRKRLGLPEQLDQTLLYLTSFENEVVTGTVIKADDGQGPR